MNATADAPSLPRAGAEHEAFFYRGTDEFVNSTSAYAREGLSRGDRVCIAVVPARIRMLKRVLGADADRVMFIDLADLGRNPARITAAWQKLAGETQRACRRLRGVGEPIWPGRSEAEIAEWHLHEGLINLAFSTGPRWLLRCSYDEEALDPSVIDQARRNHPLLGYASHRHASDSYAASEPFNLFGAPLPEPDKVLAGVEFRSECDLPSVHAIVTQEAHNVGMARERAGEFALAVYAASTNSLRHGGGPSRMRMWEESGNLVCEIGDRGQIRQPLVGHIRPEPTTQGSGRGLWLINQLCDLVQLRSGRHGTTVRLHMSTHRASAATTSG